jgi:hypothetical protein
MSFPLSGGLNPFRASYIVFTLFFVVLAAVNGVKGELLRSPTALKTVHFAKQEP